MHNSNTNDTGSEQLFHHTDRLMGNRFSVSIEHDDKQVANELITETIQEVKRIEALFTTYNESSITNQVNAMAGISPVEVPTEFMQLVQRANRISSLTQGAFDLSYGSIDKRLWNFDTHMDALPEPSVASAMVRLINYRNIIVDTVNHTIFLKERGMRIGFGGIGKGYAADKARQLLQRNGVQCGVVNAAGDLTAWGTRKSGRRWTIGIAAPDKNKQPFSSLDITDLAVATSGDYEKFATINGCKYAHTIDPKTGYPVSGIKSVTIICPHAELADAMATPVMVMGVQKGLALVNQVRDMHCIVIDEHDKLYTSTNIKLIPS